MNYGHDAGKFHPDCAGVRFFWSDKGMMIECPTCRVVAPAASVAPRVSAEDAAKTGKGIERSEFHYTTTQPGIGG